MYDMNEQFISYIMTDNTSLEYLCSKTWRCFCLLVLFFTLRLGQRFIQFSTSDFKHLKNQTVDWRYLSS